MCIYVSIHTGRAVATELPCVSLNAKSSPAELNTCKQSDNRTTSINLGCGQHALSCAHSSALATRIAVNGASVRAQ